MQLLNILPSSSLVVTFFTISIFLVKKKYRRNLLPILLALIPILIQIVGFVLNNEITSYICKIAWPCLIGPGLYMYVKLSLGRKASLGDFLHLVPFIAISFGTMTYSIIDLNDVFKLVFFVPQMTKPSIKPFMKIYVIISVGCHISYAAAILISILRKSKNSNKSYSYSSLPLSLKWFFWLIILFLILCIGTVVIIKVFSLIHSFLGYLIVISALSIFVIIFNFFSINHKKLDDYTSEYSKKQKKDSFDLTSGIHIENNKYKKSKMSETEINQYVKSLENFMLLNKPFLDAELTLEKLAEQIDIKKHKISQILNVGLSKNFYTYVNEFRVNEFKSRVNSPKFQNYSILGIAYDCGFNSKSSFNYIFKKIEGKTPSNYKKGSS